MREALWLVSNGVPWDVAMDMDAVDRQAFAIIFSEFQGHKFNTRTMRFEDDK